MILVLNKDRAVLAKYPQENSIDEVKKLLVDDGYDREYDLEKLEYVFV